MANPNISVSINTEQIMAALRGIEEDALKAVSGGLNDMAFGLRTNWIQDIEQNVNNPTSFSKKVFVNKSTPKNLTSSTYIPRLQSEYMGGIIEGGVRRVGDYASLKSNLLVPVKARINKFGNLPLGPKRWLGTLEDRIKGSFVGSPDGGSSEKGGQAAVYQRLKRGKLKLLAIFKKTIDYDKALPLYETAEVFTTDADDIMQRNLERVLS